MQLPPVQAVAQELRAFPLAPEPEPVAVDAPRDGFALDPVLTDAEKRAAARDVARQFEKVFVQELLAGLRKSAQITGEDGGLFGSGPGTDTYAQWFDDNLADQMARHGRLGVAEAIMAEFERWKQVPPEPPAEGIRITGGIDAHA